MKTWTHWKAFFQFLKNPTYAVQEHGVKNKVLLTVNSYLLDLLITLVIMFLFGLYIYLTDSLGEVEKIKGMRSNLDGLYPPLILFTLVAVYEELSYRLLLTKFKPLFFATSIAGIIANYSKKIVFKNMFWEPEGLWLAIAVALPVFLVSYLLARRYQEALTRFWESHFSKIFYVSAILFALVHFFNSPDWNLAYLKTNLSQFISGLFFGFIRIRSGLIYAIAAHFLWNYMVHLIPS